MASWTDDLDIPMSPSGRPTARALPQATVEPLTAPLTSPPVVEMSRTVDLFRSNGGPPASSIQQTTPPVAPRDEVAVRTLIVGREVSFSGEVGSCDRLVVEGNMQANIEECQNLTIAETGVFRGYASAENVDVRGHFEGDLVALKRLIIRSTGQVLGRITYREIEIERGGQISGGLRAIGGDGGLPDRDTWRRKRTHK